VDVYGGMELAGRRPAHVEYAVGDGGGAAVVHRDAGGGAGPSPPPCAGRRWTASARRSVTRCALIDGVR
jgi:hypothetical protein